MTHTEDRPLSITLLTQAENLSPYASALYNTSTLYGASGLYTASPATSSNSNTLRLPPLLQPILQPLLDQLNGSLNGELNPTLDSAYPWKTITGLQTATEAVTDPQTLLARLITTTLALMAQWLQGMNSTYSASNLLQSPLGSFHLLMQGIANNAVKWVNNNTSNKLYDPYSPYSIYQYYNPFGINSIYTYYSGLSSNTQSGATTTDDGG